MGAKVGQEYGVTKECKRSAASTAPYAYQTKTRPSTWKVDGKVPTAKSNVSGGSMNGGGKRRSK